VYGARRVLCDLVSIACKSLIQSRIGRLGREYRQLGDSLAVRPVAPIVASNIRTKAGRGKYLGAPERDAWKGCRTTKAALQMDDFASFFDFEDPCSAGRIGDDRRVSRLYGRRGRFLGGGYAARCKRK